jgi:hypothetical protein
MPVTRRALLSQRKAVFPSDAPTSQATGGGTHSSGLAHHGYQARAWLLPRSHLVAPRGTFAPPLPHHVTLPCCVDAT